MQIVHVSAECFPIAKVGGLADVVGALPKYQEASGISSRVIMPYYNNKFTKNNQSDFEVIHQGITNLGDQEYNFEILKVEKKLLGFEVFLIKVEGLTDKENVYGYPDDVERFTAFQKVTCDFILTFDKKPHVVHCHDHHTGFIPFFMGYGYKYKALKNTPTVLTIHNAQYQGDFEYDKMRYLPDFNLEHSGLIDWYSRINPLATAIKCAWRVTTVSPSYLEELKEKANGLEGLLRSETQKSLGILNGVDVEVWNPKTDPMLISNFSLNNIHKGKKANKDWLCEKYGLNPKLPLISFIGRFVYEKGSDLFPQVIHNVLGNNKLPVNIMILGSGNLETENQIKELKEKYKGKFNAHIGYDEKLSHIIYAGSDFLLMPSRVEPCGLNQMYAMRYGMIPIVSHVGGLIDTVIDVDQGEEGYGVVLNPVNVHEISFAIQRAVDIFKNQTFFKAKRRQIMQIDNGWLRSADDYIKMYQSIITN